MLELDLPLVIPSYICFSRHFEGFVQDLSSIGIKKAIVLHDFDFLCSDIYSHKRSLMLLRKRIAPVFKSASIKFEIFTNALLESRLYSLRELSCIADKRFGYYFLTVPRLCDQAVIMKNVFALKNAGFHPIINCFDSMSIVFKRSFCEALLTTENISFVFECDSLYSDIVRGYINKSLASHNTVLFSVGHFTSSVIERDISSLWNSLDGAKRMNLGYLSHKLSNQVF